MFDNTKDRLSRVGRTFFKDRDGDFDQGERINQATHSRNLIITVVILAALALAGALVWQMTREATSVEPVTQVGFGAVVGDDFTEKDNQSALTAQQLKINQLEQSLIKFESTLGRFGDSLTAELKNIEQASARNQSSTLSELERKMQDKLAEIDALKTQLTTQWQEAKKPAGQGASADVYSGRNFGEYALPPRPSVRDGQNNSNMADFQYQGKDNVAFAAQGFDSFEFTWAASEQERAPRRTVDNYVPTSTFVTAVVTGGADANAGVLGQGDTAPLVFQTLNAGILPNGKPSKLRDCTVTGSVYGEISSSRGIVRTHRLSCIQPSGDILDVPVKATAFNFGRNGIRGTTILKNGQIVKMAGISGILEGLGGAGKALSQTTTPTALGPSSSVSTDKIGLNLLGSATQSVGSKLADYYIQLAELYHPIVEVNPGAIVNLVFLEGFPLDPVLAQAYETELEEKAHAASNTNHIMDVITNAPTSAINPLADKLTQQGLNQTGFGRQE
ncbi:TrbI/VirB10 family protein [Vibrio tapetis]|uniref:Conjugativepilus assembly protein TraB n=1 Tax=Vibrio tapetis subsp. tapetis TaxID=1671868 RepID=A0A2N8ZNJ5_9VIBR|nr:TrbI/VirB10 family protein [Vibrio tapetis]SON53426.1 Conjugativepilus assembly protein TraB [Vibrio tapetis subsp. tapetis]